MPLLMRSTKILFTMFQRSKGWVNNSAVRVPVGSGYSVLRLLVGCVVHVHGDVHIDIYRADQIHTGHRDIYILPTYLEV